MIPLIQQTPFVHASFATKKKQPFLRGPFLTAKETLKGLPVKKEVTTKTIDPYFAAYIQDVFWLEFCGDIFGRCPQKRSSSCKHIVNRWMIKFVWTGFVPFLYRWHWWLLVLVPEQILKLLKLHSDKDSMRSWFFWCVQKQQVDKKAGKSKIEWPMRTV